MSNIGDLTRRLFPTGYAHSFIKDSTKDKLVEGLAVSEQEVFDGADSVLNSMLPDNTSFSSSDATRLELFLGMITNLSVPLQDRKEAIIRKLNHPGDVQARQSVDYLQNQLQLAGFSLYAHESTDSIETLGGSGGSVQAGDVQFGETQFGHVMYGDKIANSIDPLIDKVFAEDSLNRNTFIVGGAVLGSSANVDTNRRTELRQTILKIKPANTVCYALINYV